MTLHKTKYLLAVSLSILVVVSALALTKSSDNSPPPKVSQEQQQFVNTMPLIISQVKGIEVVEATLKNPGTKDVIAVLKVKNKSNKSVVAVSVETGEPEEAYGITVEGFKEGDEPPDAVIEPRGTITVELRLDNAKPGDPIRVSGAVFGDESEDGEKTAL
ncbi:MAG TPA: hypothetical protein VJ715_19780, partial [Pyrinomonadaceae bacterium]|nr:hypothetical protein [Pyrinomonadaceae bacterium]